MGNRIYGSAAIVSVGLFALVGCQSFSGFSNSASSGTPATNFISNQSSAPIDGNGAGDMAELPKRKKIDACLAAAKMMENSAKFGEAIIYYEQIREIDPKRNLFCARHLAVLYDRKGDFDKALDEYAKLLQANPKDAIAYNDLGYGYYTRGKFESAETNLRKSVEFDPKNKRAWSNLGMSLAQLERYEESLAAFEKSVNRPQALCNVAFIQAAQGKWVEARDSYAMALKLEPGLQKARVALQSMNEGRGSKDRERMEAKRRSREFERPPEVEAEIARSLPFGMPTGMIGADTGMVYITPDDQPINLPLPGSAPTPPPARMNPAAASAAAALPSIPPPLPHVETTSLPPAPVLPEIQ